MQGFRPVKDVTKAGPNDPLCKKQLKSDKHTSFLFLYLCYGPCAVDHTLHPYSLSTMLAQYLRLVLLVLSILSLITTSQAQQPARQDHDLAQRDVKPPETTPTPFRTLIPRFTNTTTTTSARTSTRHTTESAPPTTLTQAQSPQGADASSTPTSSATPISQTSSSHDGLTNPAKIGVGVGVGGGVLLILAAGVGATFWYRRRKEARRSSSPLMGSVGSHTAF